MAFTRTVGLALALNDRAWAEQKRLRGCTVYTKAGEPVNMYLGDGASPRRGTSRAERVPVSAKVKGQFLEIGRDLYDQGRRLSKP